jgi:hypothetical protein
MPADSVAASRLTTRSSAATIIGSNQAPAPARTALIAAAEDFSDASWFAIIET